MKNKMKANVVKRLSDRDHILLKPNMFCGGLNEMEKELLILEDDKFKFSKTTYVGGLVKIIDEILDNSIDEFIRTGGQFADNINITINEDSVIIEDNGRGLPHDIDEETGVPQGVIAFTEARAGSNFAEETKANGIGTNGIGSFLTNVMSTSFEVITNNGTNTLTLNCVNNCETFKHKITKKKSKPFTKVTFYPDFEKFEVDKMNDVYEKILMNRLTHITQTYDINFHFDGISFKGDIKKIKPTKYLKMFHDDIDFIVTDKFLIGVYPNDTAEFKFTTFVNGLYMKRGGSHIEYLKDNIVDDVKAKLIKKFKKLKSGDIKSKLAMVCILSDFNNLQTDSQTKEEMTNSKKQVKEYFKGDDYVKPFAKFYKGICSNKLLLDSITEVYRIKEEMARRQLLRDKDKTPKKIRSEKYMPAIKKKDYLVLLEGASAKNAITPILGRDNFGYFELKGKPLNAFDKTALEVTKNEELNLIRNILGVKASEESSRYSYKYILIATDADLDGLHITTLLFTFFAKFTDMLETGKIKILTTPIAVAHKKKKTELIMEFEDIKNYDSSWYIDYKKGLGSWEEGGNGEIGELGKIFEEHGVEKFIKTVVVDDDQLIRQWMSRDKDCVAKRKEFLSNNEFSLDVI